MQGSPGHRMVAALTRDRFRGTPAYSLVRITRVAIGNVYLSMMQSLCRGFTACNTLEWPQN